MLHHLSPQSTIKESAACKGPHSRACPNSDALAQQLQDGGFPAAAGGSCHIHLQFADDRRCQPLKGACWEIERIERSVPS